MNTVFDKRNEYTALIADKVMEIKRLCHIHKIPMFITLCVENTESKSVYEKEMISAATCGHELTDDQIVKHVNVSLGFDTVQPSQELSIDMDDAYTEYIEGENKNDDEG